MKILLVTRGSQGDIYPYLTITSALIKRGHQVTLNLPQIFEKEAKELFEDCNEYEIRVLVDVLKATKQSLRTVKLFEDKIEDNR